MFSLLRSFMVASSNVLESEEGKLLFFLMAF
jgi:hypothetical protein